MDIDISDILADVSRSQPQSSQLHQYSMIDTDTFIDHQLLTRAWTSERCAPDLLPYPTELMARVMARVQAQISRIEDLANGVDDDASSYSYGAANGTGKSGGGAQNSNLILAILQTDLSRTQFLVRSLLRQRLAKITKHAMFYLTRRVESDSKTSATMSASEVAFLRHHQALLGELYESSFLNVFPQGLRRLDDSSGGVPMVEGPAGSRAVVVRCLSEATWSNTRDVDDARDRRDDEGATVVLTMSRGEVWIVRWRDVKKGVERGDIELL